MNKNLKRKKKGFTLVEVIIVLAIIAIIAAIAIPNLTKVRQDSKKKADTQTCEVLKRTTETLIVGETIKYNTSGSNSVLTITIDASGNVQVVGATLGDGVLQADLNSYYKDVNKPQQDDAVSYSVEIDTTGTVKNVKVLGSTTGSVISSVTY